MATHSSILAWRTPQTEEPGGLQPIGSQRVRHDWSGLAHIHTERHEDDKGLFFIYGAGTWRTLLIPLLPRAPSLLSEPSFRFLLRRFKFFQILLINSVFTYINHCLFLLFSSVQSLIRVQLFATPWTAARQAPLAISNSWSLLKLMSIESVMPSNHLIFCCPLLLPPSIFPSIRVFSNESVLHIRWPKYWSFSFSISPSNEYSGLISFRMDWLDLLAVQGTLKSLLQQHSSKASILQHSNFFIVQLSHSFMTTGKKRSFN